MDRAERRRLAKLKKRQARRLMRLWGKAATPDNLGRYARTPHPCSCPSCGNPRPYEGASHAECRQARTNTDEEET